jgi:hypothetical protein
LKELKLFVLVLSMMVALTLTSSATTLLINQQNPYLGYGYGAGSWNTFDGYINAAFGPGNVTVDANPLTNLAYMEQFDSLMVVPENPGQALTPTETANIAAYIGTGRRVFLMGENSAWASWDNSVLGAVGGSYSGTDTSDVLIRVVVNQITMDQALLDTLADGIAVGGTSLYNENVLTMWSDNAVSLLSVNVVDDINGVNNQGFEKDIALWLAASAPVPEPGTLLMLGTGVAGLVGFLRRKIS